MFRMPSLSRPVFLGSALALITLLGAGAFVARQAANAAEPLEGGTVSAGDLRILSSASRSCPALTPARLAGQVMAASAFGATPVEGMRDNGATGVAALTPQQWQQNIPWEGAQPTDREAAITALAHLTCGLTGQARALNLGEDPWKLALAARRIGLDGVIKAGGLGDAKDHVDTVDRYATWYALQPEFGGAAASPPAIGGYTAAGTVVPVPDAYVAAVVSGGKVCAEVPPALLAAQVMATSGFDPGKLGPAGEQGIAQFLPRVWQANVKAANRSPWQPVVSIQVLGRTMCKLVKKSGGQYAPALAAFTRGSDAAAVTALAETITKAQEEYAKDTRLQVAPKNTAPAVPKPSKSSAPKPKETGRANQPAIKATEVKSGNYGPYFILNLATEMCVDIGGYGPGVEGGDVNQFPCAKTTDDNQEWTFEPRGVDGDGNQLYWIRNVDDGRCIDAPGKEAVGGGTELRESLCLPDDNQDFRLEKKKTVGKFVYYWIVNAVGGNCLDVTGSGDGGADARLTLSTCKANDDHDWALVEKSEW
ncbi:RICIN domain-containing protein [Actinoplanes sp. G11-F43]|uniref:RICIN domain-containing protein n=1 Tax=Actinoplanes sp. G11-F43 TaxID=3424130 RepID=UPI003D34E45D